MLSHILGFPGDSAGEESACHCRRLGFDPWVRKIPWRRKWQPTPIILPGESHGQRNLVGYNPPGRERVKHDLATKQQQPTENHDSKRYMHSNVYCSTIYNSWDLEET